MCRVYRLKDGSSYTRLCYRFKERRGQHVPGDQIPHGRRCVPRSGRRSVARAKEAMNVRMRQHRCWRCGAPISKNRTECPPGMEGCRAR